MSKTTFDNLPITCDGCSEMIRNEMEEVEGIEMLEVDTVGRSVTIEHDKSVVSQEELARRLSDAGFPPRSEPSPGPVARSRPYLFIIGALILLALVGYAGYELYPRFDLPAVDFSGLIVLSIGAGVASFFSPCVFPLLVTLLARESGRGPGTARRAVLFATSLSIGAALFLILAGAAIAFGAGTLFAGVTFTSTAGRTIRTTVGIFLIVLGLVQMGILPNPLHRLGVMGRPFMRAQARRRRDHPVLSFGLFGFGYLLAGFG
ncbi:MAG: cation transporter [Acidobacteria bacterium]|nr:cation transporter [Acidobacteriota bacterium]